jgi:hypothetical protein
MTCARPFVCVVLLLASTPAGAQTPAPPAGQPATPASTPAPAPPSASAPPAAAPVSQQPPGSPPGPFALDVRLAMPSFNTGSALADPLSLRTDQLPGRGWGLLFGAHVYPLRGKRFALGLGADIVRTSGSQAPDPEDDTAATDPTIETKFSAFVPQVSLNFGSSRGWSYIGGGYAWTRRSTGDVDAEVAEGTRLMGLHYGGGARWFMSPHVAFSFDLRFYRLPEQAAEGTTTGGTGSIAFVPFQPKSRLFLASAGLSFK